MSDRYAVFGRPVKQSRSPGIHRRFAEQTGQDIAYAAIEPPTAGFEKALRSFVSEGGRGANVTVPFKEEAVRLADRLTEPARTSGAVNTVRVENDGTLTGHNTDGEGLVRDLVANRGIALSGRSILLVGAGGAARGIMPALLAEEPVAVHIANRTPDRARLLAQRFREAGAVTGSGLDDLPRRRFEIVINATPAGLSGGRPAIPASVVTTETTVYEMVYGEGAAPLLEWARAQGAARTLDGWGMLVEQAAAAFAFWRGMRPDTAPLLAGSQEALR